MHFRKLLGGKGGVEGGGGGGGGVKRKGWRGNLKRPLVGIITAVNDPQRVWGCVLSPQIKHQGHDPVEVIQTIFRLDSKHRSASHRLCCLGLRQIRSLQNEQLH